MATMPVVKPGDPVYHIAELSDSKIRRIKKQLENVSNRDLFGRVRTDLSTSFHEI